MNNDLLMQKKAKQRKFCLACTIFHHFLKKMIILVIIAVERSDFPVIKAITFMIAEFLM